MMSFKEIITVTSYAIETVGVAVIVAGSVIASVMFLAQLRRHAFGDAYHNLRRNLGRSIILGLEFLIAGDIIRTVIVSETLGSIASLALIIAIRAFLSITLHLEVEGRWPWQPPPREVRTP